MAHADYNIGHGLAIKLNGSPVAIDPVSASAQAGVPAQKRTQDSRKERCRALVWNSFCCSFFNHACCTVLKAYSVLDPPSCSRRLASPPAYLPPLAGY